MTRLLRDGSLRSDLASSDRKVTLHKRAQVNKCGALVVALSNDQVSNTLCSIHQASYFQLSDMHPLPLLLILYRKKGCKK